MKIWVLNYLELPSTHCFLEAELTNLSISSAKLSLSVQFQLWCHSGGGSERSARSAVAGIYRCEASSVGCLR